MPARLLLLVLCCGLCLGPARAWADDRDLIIATATMDGTFHPVGVGLGALISVKLAGGLGVSARAMSSAGSAENLRLLREGRADLALLQGLYGQQAYNGEGPYQGAPFQDFRAVTMLWENVEHFVLLSRFAATGTIADLGGLRGHFAIGKRESGSEGSGRAILEALGLDTRGLTMEHLGYVPAVQAMLDNRLAGANIPAGPPIPAIGMLLGQLGPEGVRILEFTDAQLETLRARYPIWNRYVIPAGTYPGQDADVRTVAQPNFLACRASLPEDVVYAVTRAIFENLHMLHEIHAATRAMAPERAAVGLPVPLHPGAERYLREIGAIP